MAKLTNTTIYGAANITGNVVTTGYTFDISALSGINISSGNSITSVTLANTGLNYQTVPSVTFANTTTGGVTANANAVMKITSTFTIGNVGAGYANGDYLYANSANSLANAVFQVTSNTATTYGTGGINGLSMPNPGLFFTMPTYANATGVLNTGDPRWIQITGTSGLGGGANVNVAVGGIQVSNVYFQTTGSGYVEQPTVTFSGGSPNTQATGYAAVGGGTIIKALGSTGTQSLDFYTPSSIVNGVPGLRLRDTIGDCYPMFFSSIGTVLLLAQSSTNATLTLSSAGTSPINLQTNGNTGTTHLRIAHAASAVNYLQIQGAATGNSPTISSQGSDTNVDISVSAKGTTGSVVMLSPLKLLGYTVATLPTAGTVGRTAYVTDATAPTYLGTLTGGGAVRTPVFDNGTAWVSY
jgi:hypothetical protein